MPAPARRFGARQQVNLGWAFVERQTNLWKRHWAWEVVWLVYGVVNTLAITFIAKQLTAEGVVSGQKANDLILFLLIGTLVWAYLSAVLDDISLVITWERWEGTIEHTLMAPVPRVAQLIGTATFGVLHARDADQLDHGVLAAVLLRRPLARQLGDGGGAGGGRQPLAGRPRDSRRRAADAVSRAG